MQTNHCVYDPPTDYICNMRFLITGDSYVNKLKSWYTTIPGLNDITEVNGISISMKMFGKSGGRVASEAHRTMIRELAIVYQPKAIILFMGANDLSNAGPFTDEDYMNLAALRVLENLILFAKKLI